MRARRIILCIVLVTAGLVGGVMLHTWYLSRKVSPKSQAPISAFIFHDVITSNDVVAEFSALHAMPPDQFRGAAEVLINRVTPEALPTAAHVATTQFSGSQSATLLNLIWPKWVAVDPPAVLDFASKQPFGEYQFSHVLGLCAARGPKLVEQWASTNADERLKPQVLRAVAQGYAAKDPEAAWRITEKFPNSAERHSTRTLIILDLMRKDPRAAVERADKESSSSDNGILHTALGGWLRADSAAALKWISEMSNGPKREGAIQLATSLTVSDPAAVAPLVLSLPAGDHRKQSIGNLARAWATKDINGAIQWTRTLKTDGDLDAAWRSIANQASTSDNIELVAQIIEQNPRREFVSYTTAALMGRWVQRDAAAALAWAKRLPPGEARNQAMPLALNAMAKTDPGEATRLCAETMPVASRQYTLPAYLRAWALASPKAAAQFVLHSSASSERPQLIKTVASAWTETDAPAASQWANSLPMATDRQPAQLAVLDVLTKTDLAAAAHHLQTIPFSGPVTNTAVAILSDWTKQDFAACSKWADSLPAGPLQDCAFYAMAKWRIDSGDIAPAQTLADRMQNKVTGAQLRYEIIETWGEHDPKAAAEWVAKLGTAYFKPVEHPSAQATVPKFRKPFGISFVDPPSAYSQLPGALDLTLGKWAKRDPAQAASFVQTKLAGTDQRRGELLVIHSWMQVDVAATTKWILNQTPASHHEVLLQQMATYLKHDPLALAAWVKTLPASNDKDSVLSRTVLDLGYNRHRDAAELSTQIVDEPRRMAALRHAVNEWAHVSPTDLKTWISTNSLPESEKAQLLSSVRYLLH